MNIVITSASGAIGAALSQVLVHGRRMALDTDGDGMDVRTVDRAQVRLARDAAHDVSTARILVAVVAARAAARGRRPGSPLRSAARAARSAAWLRRSPGDG